MNPNEPRFHEVGYRPEREHDDTPIEPNPAYAGLFPRRTVKA